MKGYIRIEILSDIVRVRLERTGDRFDQLRDAFYAHVPSAYWNHEIRWMLVPRTDYKKLMAYCTKWFSLENIQVSYRALTIKS